MLLMKMKVSPNITPRFNSNVDTAVTSKPQDEADYQDSQEL